MKTIKQVKQQIETDIKMLGFPEFEWVEEPELIVFYEVINPRFDKVVERLEEVYGDTQEIRKIKAEALETKKKLEILYGCDARIDTKICRTEEGDIFVDTCFFPQEPEHRRISSLSDKQLIEMYKQFLTTDQTAEVEKQKLKMTFQPAESKMEIIYFFWTLEETLRDRVGDLEKLIKDTLGLKIDQSRSELLENRIEKKKER